MFYIPFDNSQRKMTGKSISRKATEWIIIIIIIRFFVNF